MSKYLKEVKEKAIYLSEKGWRHFRIFKDFGVPESTIKGWLFKCKRVCEYTIKYGNNAEVARRYHKSR